VHLPARAIAELALMVVVPKPNKLMGFLLRLVRYLVWFVTWISLAVDCDLEWPDNPAVGMR
jgi:hypothetical protein